MPSAPPQVQVPQQKAEDSTKAPIQTNTPTDADCPWTAAFPFGVPPTVAGIDGRAYYATAQTLVQQVAYTLSDRLFTYSPGGAFALDDAVAHWASQRQSNGRGRAPAVMPMETRLGAANVLLGYIFGRNVAAQASAKAGGARTVAQSVIAASATLTAMRPALAELAALYARGAPFVAHVAAVDYEAAAPGRLVTDYAAVADATQQAGAALLASSSAHEAQHMALFATLAATVLPAVHVYDGVRMARESVRVADLLDQRGLQAVYESVAGELHAGADAGADADKRRRADPATRLARILRSLNAELGTAYDFFEYEGHAAPDVVLVVFGSVEATLASAVAASLARGNGGARVGVVAVRVWRPFAEQAFLEVLPRSVRRVAVLGQVTDEAAVADAAVQSTLFGDVAAAVAMSGIYAREPPIADVKYARAHIWTPADFARLFAQLLAAVQPHVEPEPAHAMPDAFAALAGDAGARQYAFWTADDDAAAVPAAAAAARLLTLAATTADTARLPPPPAVAYAATFDNAALAGTLHCQIRTSRVAVDAPFAVDAADVSIVGTPALLHFYDIVAGTRAGGAIVVRARGGSAIAEQLPVAFRHALAKKGVRLLLLDTKPAVDSASGGASPAVESALVLLAFFRVAELPPPPSLALAAVARLGDAAAFNAAAAALDSALVAVDVPKAWLADPALAVADANAIADANAADPAPPADSVRTDLADPAAGVATPALPAAPRITSFAANTEKRAAAEPEPLLLPRQAAARALAFPEACGAAPALRPDVGAKTFVVTVQENRRLTPVEYDRNVFHLELDLAGSGLAYSIGDALGVHAYNDERDVRAFMAAYGLRAGELVALPARDDAARVELRTVFQALQQNLDVFGRPPKRFYAALAEHATDDAERRALLAVAAPTPAGAAAFRQRAEADAVSYADVLLDFPSARPPFAQLARMVAPLRRREYSIASAPEAHPGALHLLVVAVRWTDARGRERHGLASRHLARLSVGARLVVSVKPSAMQLPADPAAPLILAGLGTGLAPFRAFVQHRAWQRQCGVDIGPVLLYLGSRHRALEYLYGEEWEAYAAAGIVTLLACAFSRDQPRKLYIQDRMRQTLPALGRAYLAERGSFYLCGPTWPVPDVARVLEEAVRAHHGPTARVNPARELEALKDAGRYVLEVY